MWKFTHRITKANKKASNKFDQEPLEYPDFPAYPAIAPPSSSCHRLSIMTDGHFEGSSAEKRVYHGSGKEFTGGRCT
jgi:hypothetical protein